MYTIAVITALVAAATPLFLTQTATAAVKFDADRGTGFISKGELQSALKLTNAEFQEAVSNGAIRAIFVESRTVWNIGCSEGDNLNNFVHTQGAALGFKLVTNPQGQITGIELTGHLENDPYAFGGGPGSVCNERTEISKDLLDFDVTHIEVHGTSQLGGITRLPVR